MFQNDDPVNKRCNFTLSAEVYDVCAIMVSYEMWPLDNARHNQIIFGANTFTRSYLKYWEQLQPSSQPARSSALGYLTKSHSIFSKLFFHSFCILWVSHIKLNMFSILVFTSLYKCHMQRTTIYSILIYIYQLGMHFV